MERTRETAALDSRKGNIENLEAYEVISHEYLPDIDSDSWLLRHKKTGARVALLPRDDNNKVFYIAFRTPPEDSTGVAHIIEHTVLCGSRDFPIKDPFIELAKGSLNTFLNAMTYPDKTVYPIASCNEQDFKNLMHVYLDAVFYPNIYKEQNIFRQEGWHYEAESADSEITINGVVYNEMKGALSSAEDILGREINSALYPHTPYAHESGGDPVCIPDLTYEAYLDFHRRYYHPSNSYIYLYGDMDMAERLTWIDENYLSCFDRLEIDSSVPLEPAFENPVEARKFYSILPEEEKKGKSFLSWNVAVAPDSLDAGLNMAIQILDYALCDAEGAPVRKALRDRGIGEDVYASFESGIRQPSFSIVSKYTDPDRKEEFVSVIRETLEKLADEGIDRRALTAGINRYEFRYREADFGSYSKGLIYGLNALESWLYDDRKPFEALKIGDFFDFLRQESEKGYFENIIRKNLLENPHCAVLVLEPEPGLSKRLDEETKEKLAAMAKNLSAAEREIIISDFAALRAWQQKPDAEEDIRKIPMLSREDLTREAVSSLNVLSESDGLSAVTHPLSTNRIDYLTFLFDIRDLPEDYIRHLGIFKTLFSVLDTENYSYAELDHEINICTGGIGSLTGFYNWYGDPSRQKGGRLTFEVTVKTLHKNLTSALSLVQEIMMKTRYDMPARIREVLEEERAGMRAGMASAGHATAAQRALSYISEGAAITDLISGLSAYQMLDETCAKLSDGEDGSRQVLELCSLLSDMSKTIFRRDNLTFDCTACKEDIPEILTAARELAAGLNPSPDRTFERFDPVLDLKNEGLTTAGQVQFVCRAGRFTDYGLKSTGVFRVLRVLMGYEYLWGRVRVEGGAYGCMSSFTRDGNAFLVSYRDPHLRRTIKVFEEAADFLRSFDADERTMTKYIIGAVSALDQPMTPFVYGRYSLTSYLTGLTDEQVQIERDQVLNASPEDIRAMAAYLDAVMAAGCLCVVGSDSKIRECPELFREIRKLL